MSRTSTLAQLSLSELATPTGTMLIVTDDEYRVRALDWSDYADRMQRLLRLHYGKEGVGYALQSHPLPSLIRHALDAYFAGDLAAIDRIPVHTGGTEFQRKVWRALRTIPAGRTLTYSGLALQLGQPTAVRAVGLANGANPIGVVVPCHRVIGANGSLTGYGGGLARKQWLLAHEGVMLKL